MVNWKTTRMILRNGKNGVIHSIEIEENEPSKVLKSVGLTYKDLADLAQEWDDLIRDAAYPEKEILKKWLKEEQKEEEPEHSE